MLRTSGLWGWNDLLEINPCLAHVSFSCSTTFSVLVSSGFSLLGFGRLASESRSFYQCLVGFLRQCFDRGR